MNYTLSDIIPTLQPMIAAKLNSEPFFSQIAIFAIEEKDITSQISSALAGWGGNVQGQTGKKAGMILMDDSIAQLYRQGLISADEAIFRSENKPQMKALCNH